MGKELEAASMALMEVERDRATTDGLRDEELEFGSVGVREGGRCCLIRRRPERPRPCSWSAIRGDLGQGKDKVSDMSQDARLPCLAGDIDQGASKTDLVRAESGSRFAAVAISKDIR